MEIAEREHKKWLRPDVELANNPYTEEGLEARAKHLLELSSLELEQVKNGENDSEDEEEDEATRFEKKKFFSDRDIGRYKRDYYLPKNRPTFEDSQVFSILNVGALNIFYIILIIFIYSNITDSWWTTNKRDSWTS